MKNFLGGLEQRKYDISVLDFRAETSQRKVRWLEPSNEQKSPVLGEGAADKSIRGSLLKSVVGVQQRKFILMREGRCRWCRDGLRQA